MSNPGRGIVLGSDGTVGGPGGTPLAPSVAIVSSANTFTGGQQTFLQNTASSQPAGATGAEVDIAPTATTLALQAKHLVNWSAFDASAHDLIDLYHKSTGDAIFVVHTGGILPAGGFTFTATTNGTNILSAVSSFIGLTVGTPVTGTNIPANTTITGYNVGAATVTMSNPASDSTAGKTITVPQPGASGGGDSIFNGLIPYYLDDVGTGLAGSVMNNRSGMNGLFIQNQPAGSTGNAINLKSWAAGAAIYLNNQPAAGAPPSVGNGIGISIDENSTAPTFIVNRAMTPAAGKATMILGTSVASAIDVFRINDSAGAGRVVMRADGTTGLGVNYSTSALNAVRLQVEFTGSGIQRTLALTNVTGANGNGNQIEFDVGGVQHALIQGVADTNGAAGSLRFQVRTGVATLTERFRMNATGLSFFGVNVVAQQTAAGNATTTAAGATTNVFTNTTFPGASGATAYTIGDIVTALKNYGLLTA